MSKRNSVIAKKVDQFMANLPSDYLKEYATTQDLLNEWLSLRHESSKLGECLKARFAGGGGNPAHRAMQSGEIDRVDYEIVMATVDWYESIFNLTQPGWEYINQELSEALEDYPSTELEMYLEILRGFFDIPFQMALEGCKVSVQQQEKNFRLFDQGCNGISEENLVVLTPDLRKKLNHIKERSPKVKNPWLLIVTGILFDKQKQDRPLRRLCRKYFVKMRILLNLHLSEHRKERGQNKPNRYQSRQFKNGELYIGTKGGYRKLTELNQSKSIF